MLYCTVLYCTVLYCTVLYCTGVVVLAVPVFSWPLLPLDTLQPATVIIDPSNRAAKCPPDTQSQVQNIRLTAVKEIPRKFLPCCVS